MQHIGQWMQQVEGKLTEENLHAVLMLLQTMWKQTEAASRWCVAGESERESELCVQ